jgi:hypothetical protein
MKLRLLLLFSLVSFSLWAQKPIVEVKIIQNGEEIEVKDNEVSLQKDEFALEIRFNKKKIKFLMLNASSQDNYYVLNENEEIPNTKYLTAFSVAEYPFNLDRRIYDDLEIFNNLAPPFEHRGNLMHHFSTYEAKCKWATGLKEIRKIHVEDEDILIKDWDGQTIYLFLVGIDKKHDESQNLNAEAIIYKWKLKINWK